MCTGLDRSRPVSVSTQIKGAIRQVRSVRFSVSLCMFLSLFLLSSAFAMPVEGPGHALPHAYKADKVVPHSFKNP